MHLRALSFVLCAAVPAGLAAAPPVRAGDTQAPTVTARVRLLRNYVDFVKLPGGGEESRRIKIYFDYDRGIARQTTENAAGTVLEEKIISGTEVRPTAQEFAEAVAIVRADRILGGMLTRVNAVPDGGFLLEEPEGRVCGPRSRCLHVMWLSPDRVGTVRWTVVDLVRQAIAYRAYVAPETIAAMEQEGVAK